MSSNEERQSTPEHDEDYYYGPSPYPSIIVNRGALPESWFPKWLKRRMLGPPKKKRSRRGR